MCSQIEMEAETEASKSESERCGKLLAAALRNNTVLHTFVFDICPSHLLDEAVQTNHSLIVCRTADEKWFDRPLLFNRVSAFRLAIGFACISSKIDVSLLGSDCVGIGVAWWWL